MTTKTKEELYHITQAEPGMQAFVAEPDPSGRPTFTYLYRFQVPIGKHYTFKPGHTFALEAPALDDDDYVRVELRSSNELSRIPLIESALGARVDEFTDKDQMCRLDIGEPVVASAGMWVVISVLAAAAIDPATCYFVLTCDRTRQGII